ncbi:helix-turn-helix domain-containing protein [Methylobacterium sp. C25]|uniref:GlxA family transcriptional regulator n=1 Tax=Methylobacterium sp. C25 TaxID=2721622 RepID=UPI001F453ADE|nr:DJ-1/PfpI family protein [Methylobacterium sp. C25]MCE4226617.1 helix-turn-helix domain-containing protein [Methylobacterium sp. C25]
MDEQRNVCIVVYPGVASYDVAGPVQALRATGLGTYAVTLASVSGGLVESDCPGVAFGSVPAASVGDLIDTLIIPGGNAALEAIEDPALIEWVATLARRATRVACVCTGAFLAAKADLLVTRRAATHWRFCDELERRFPHIKADRDRIWIKDGRIWTSAGISAGVDLTLALIEEDLGIETALEAARELVVFFKRPGGQSQFSTLLSGQIADTKGPVRKLLAWIADNLAADLRAESLAERAGMSLRTLTRTCVAGTGMAPAKLVETLRVQAAREAIERSDTNLERIAGRYGFGDQQRMRRAFVRHLNATPNEIRSRFGRASVGGECASGTADHGLARAHDEPRIAEPAS